MEIESIEEAEDDFKLDSKIIPICLISFAVGMILVSVYLITSEIIGAKNSCEDKGFIYQFKIPYKHLCNDEIYFKYNNGWDFEREFNISEINFSNFLINP